MTGAFTVVNRFFKWLGTGRTRLVFLLFVGTGLLSLVLNAAIRERPDLAAQVALVQSLLLITFLVGAVITIITRFDRRDQGQIALLIVPALIAASGALLFPNLALLFLPVAVGWIVLASGAMRGRMRREYQTAIKAMRKRDYPTAIQTITEVMQAEPENADHVRFRAELYRLSGKIRRAREDYQKVVELNPDSAVGYNGLAEVSLQDSDYAGALPYAEKALALAPNEWITPYNLGMIEDRLGKWTDSAAHLQAALQVGIPDSRHRVLTYLWLTRSAVKRGADGEARDYVERLKREEQGLKEWATIFESEEARVLKDVLSADIAAAEILIKNGDVGILV